MFLDGTYCLIDTCIMHIFMDTFLFTNFLNTWMLNLIIFKVFEKWIEIPPTSHTQKKNQNAFKPKTICV